MAETKTQPASEQASPNGQAPAPEPDPGPGRGERLLYLFGLAVALAIGFMAVDGLTGYRLSGAVTVAPRERDGDDASG